MLAIAEILGSIVAGILSFIPFVGPLIGVVMNALFLVLAILGIVNVAGGKAKELPVIGCIQLLK